MPRAVPGAAGAVRLGTCWHGHPWLLQQGPPEAGGPQSWLGFFLAPSARMAREGEGEVLGSAVDWQMLAMMPREC